MPMEIPSLPPPVGFQLVRDPSTGQFLFLPAATTIGKACGFKRYIIWVQELRFMELEFGLSGGLRDI